MDKRILSFSLIYSFSTSLFIFDIFRDPIRSIEYILIFPAFWIIGAIGLYILSKKSKINYKKNLNKIAFIFGTPLPYVFAYFTWLFVYPAPSKIVYHLINGKEEREDHYQYPDHHDRKVEYWSSEHSISSYQKIGEIKYKLDSVYYFDHEGYIVEKVY